MLINTLHWESGCPILEINKHLVSLVMFDEVKLVTKELG